MPFGVRDLLYGAVIPAAAAAGAALIVRRLLPDDPARRFAAAVGLAVGFLAGYGLQTLGPWIPASHWHWLPWLIVATAVVGPIANAPAISTVERLLLYACAATVAAWLLVPHWEDLDPPRRWYLIACGAFIAATAGLLEPLARRQTGLVLSGVLSLSLACGAIVLALSESLRFAAILVAGFGAMSGVFAAGCFRKTLPLSGLALPFAVLLCGMMLVGRVNSFSDVPLAAYLLVPIAPLTLWAGVGGPLARPAGWKRVVTQLAIPLAVGAAAIVLAAMQSLDSEW